MPPKKKTRLSSRAASSPLASTPKEPTPAASVKAATELIEPDRPVLDPDPWTDDQESALFKGIVQWKPVGMHKHFRMLSLSNYVKNSGFNEDHTKPKGIWQKLETLYNLKTLDEREDSLGELGGDDDDTSDIHVSFKLPKDEYGDLMFDRRIETETSSSPPALHHQLSDGNDLGTAKASTADDNEGPRSSPGAIRGVRGSRRGRGPRGGRVRQQEPTRRGGKKTSPSEEVEDENDEGGEDEEGEEEEDSDDSEGEGDEEDEDEDDEAEGEEEPSKSRTASRGTRGKRGRGRGGRGRGRGGRSGRGGRGRGR